MENRGISLQDILIFVEVVKHGGFTSAAAMLDMPVSTVSRRLSILESQLGAQLLVRTTRKVSTTTAGVRYFEECVGHVEAALNAHEVIQSYVGRPEGTLRVSIPSSLTALLPALVAAMRRDYPKVRLDIVVGGGETGHNPTPFELLIRGGPQRDSLLIQRPVLELRRVLIASRAYLNGAGRPRVPADLHNHELLAVATETDWELRRNGETCRIPVSSTVVTESASLNVQLAMAGGGIAWMPCDLLLDHGATRRTLERVLPEWELPPTTLYALSQTRVVSARAQAFLDTFKELLPVVPKQPQIAISRK